MLLDEKSIAQVDQFGEKLRDRLETELRERLQTIGIRGELAEELDLKKAEKSDLWSAKMMGIDEKGEPIRIRKNWIQCNGEVYFNASYSSPIPWKLQARFSSPPGSLLWEKKPPYIHDRQPQEWSLSGDDVWAISYEKLAAELLEKSQHDIMDEVLDDLCASWCYANKQQPPRDSANCGHEGPGSGEQEQPPQDSANTLKLAGGGRVDITFSIDAKKWSELREIVNARYRPRRNHPKRPSYAQLYNDAIDTALMLYINWWKGLGKDESQPSEK